jgi:hypothetical protein
MPKGDFEIFWIFAELFELKLLKNRLPLSLLQRGVKNTALGNPYFLLFWNVFGEQLSTWVVHFLLHCPFKGRGSPSKILKITLRCQQWLPAVNEAGSRDSRSNQCGEYWLSVLNDRRKFIQILLTNGDSPPKWCGESQLTLVNNTGNSDSPL